MLISISTKHIKTKTWHSTSAFRLPANKEFRAFLKYYATRPNSSLARDRWAQGASGTSCGMGGSGAGAPYFSCSGSRSRGSRIVHALGILKAGLVVRVESCCTPVMLAAS